MPPIFIIRKMLAPLNFYKTRKLYEFFIFCLIFSVFYDKKILVL